MEVWDWASTLSPHEGREDTGLLDSSGGEDIALKEGAIHSWGCWERLGILPKDGTFLQPWSWKLRRCLQEEAPEEGFSKQMEQS